METTKSFASEPEVVSGQRVRLEIQQEIEQFLYAEARLLDDRHLTEWYNLLAEDLHYYMPTRYNRARREAKYEFSNAHETAHFDDDKASIWQRIKRLQSGTAWSEEPPSRTRHLVTNVQIRPTTHADEFEVDCCYVLYRSRLEGDVDLFAGSRVDRLRRVQSDLGWQIARRTIILDQTVIQATNLSIFF